MGNSASAQAPSLGARLARLSIRWKLTIILGLAMLVPMGAFAVWDLTQERRDMLNRAERELLMHARDVAQAIDAYLLERQHDAQDVAMGPLPIRVVGGSAPLTDLEHRILEGRIEGGRRAHGYLRVALLKADGAPVVTVGAAIPLRGAEIQRVFEEALTGRPTVSDPFFAGPEGPCILEVAAPVQDATGATRGVVLVALPFDRIVDIMRAATGRAGTRTGALVDEYMIRIAHASDPALVGRPLIPLPEELRRRLAQSGRFGPRTAELLGNPAPSSPLAENITRLRRQPTASPFYDAVPVSTGQRSRAVVALLSTRPWAFSWAVPYDVFMASARAALTRGITVFAAGSGLLVVLIWALGGIMTRRLGRLADATDRLTLGDLTVRVEAGPLDEIGRVARSFNAMTEAVQAQDAAKRERMARLEALSTVGRAVASTLNLDQALSLIVQESVQAIGVNVAVIHEIDPQTGRLHIKKGYGISTERMRAFVLEPGEGLAGAAIKEGRPVRTEDLAADPRFHLSEGVRAVAASEGIRAALAAPIRTPAGIYGTLFLYRHDPRPFDPDEIRIVALLADQAGHAVQNSRLYAEARDASLYARSLIEAGLDPLVTIDREGRITDANRATELATGVPLAQLQGSEFAAYFTDPANAREGYRAVLAAGFVRGHPLTLRHTSGNTREVLYNASLYRNEAGEVQGIFAAARDVTERVRAEERVREQLEMLGALYTGARNLAEGLDLKEVTEKAVRACVELLGARSAWLGEALPDGRARLLSQFPDQIQYAQKITVRWDDTPEGQGPTGRAIRSGLPVVTADILSDPDFDPWRAAALEAEFCTSAAFPLISRGKTSGALNLYSDQPGFFSSERVQLLQSFAHQVGAALENARMYGEIERHAAELEQHVAARTADLQATMKELEAFSYSVSHDLRAPLRAMDGFSRILLDHHAAHLDPDGQRYLHMVRENAQRMGHLIDDLLSFSRLGRQPLKTKPVALAPLVRNAFEELRAELAGRRVELSVGDLPACHADPALLKQVFLNLLSNAIKFTRRQEAARIQVGHRAQDGEVVYFVRDNGVGFDTRYAGKLFGVFQRLHAAEEYEGTGVGLAIVQRIVHRHGGRVWAEAEPDKGATFYFTLGGGPG